MLRELVEAGELPEDLPLDAVTAEPPRDKAHGDIATNAAMVVAKKAGKPPREIAQIIVDKLKPNKTITNIEIAGPGFINITLDNSIWYKLLKSVLELGNSYGNSDMGGGQKVNVEYVSANPTGPMHIGHARGAVVGDAVSLLLLKAGYDVTKEFYINDAGSQVDTLGRSAYLRYREALGEDIGEIPEGLYPGEYLKTVGESFARLHERDFLHADEEIWLPVIREFALESMLTLIKHDLLELGVQHDVFISEKSLVDEGAVDAGIKALEDKGLVYKGVLEPPKGKVPDDWEEREQLLFRSSDFGDDIDRPLKKSDDSNTYFASDIAYHKNKIDRGFNKMVLSLGADHSGYIKRIKAAVSALGNGQAEIDVVIHQLVNFLEDGEPVKMSKRAGVFTTVRDVVDAVGKDIVRFIMLTKKSDTVLDFDLKKVTEQSRDNPVFYVQYAHARAHSVFRKLREQMPELEGWDYQDIDNAELALLQNEQEIALIKAIAEWPRIIEAAAKFMEPHRIAFYLQDLSAIFHTLWNAGKGDVALRFIMEDNQALTKARIALVRACAITIASGLHVIGVEPVVAM